VTTQISGYHHVSLPVTNVLDSSDWYERVFGFARVVIEEQENSVTAAILRHPAGIFLCLHNAPGRLPRWDGPALAAAVLSFRVPGYADLAAWEQRLTELGVEHSTLHDAHLGWAVDLLDPDGTCIQLHTAEAVSVEDV
jgi:catechol 2,3-dioxygenase-like lactoylglutathione lyase family enzyme